MKSPLLLLIGFSALLMSCSPEKRASSDVATSAAPLAPDMNPSANALFSKPLDSCGPVEFGSTPIVLKGFGASSSSKINALAVPASAYNAALPKPQRLRIVGDDHRVRLIWDQGGRRDLGYWTVNPLQHMVDLVSEKAAIGQGYYIEILDLTTRAVMRKTVTIHRELDIQSLIDASGNEVPFPNGVDFEAVVYRVDSFGKVSDPASIVIRADSNRISRLRQICTAFFDDFNLSAGAFDELKWNNTHGINNSDKYNGSFVNTQMHAHSMLSNEEREGDFYNDRGRVFSRPRALMSLAGGATRRIMFNLDGSRGGRDLWYLDFYPGAVNNGRLDANGAESAFLPALNEVTGYYPGGFIRLNSGGGTTRIELYSNRGRFIKAYENEGFDYNNYAFLDRTEARAPVVPNVQRFWEINFSKTRMDVYIDGRWVVGGDLTLGSEYDTTQMAWVAFTYNTAKDDENRVELVHWDNFGFDGPKVTTDVVHNYMQAMTAVGGVDRFNGDTEPSVNVEIPDSIQGATAAHLFFTLHPYGYNHAYTDWNANNHIMVNGGSRINMPDPYVLFSALTDQRPDTTRYEFMNGNQQFPVVLPINLSALRTGTNTFKFNGVHTWMNNIHVELTFPASAEPAYTQPYQIHGKNQKPGTERLFGMPGFWLHGPRVMYSALGDTQNSLDQLPGTKQTRTLTYARSTARISVRVDDEPMILGTGGNPGLNRALLMIDGRVVQEIALNSGVVSAPVSWVNFDVNMGAYADGAEHTLVVVAYDAAKITNSDGSITNGRESFIAHTNANAHVGIENVSMLGAVNPSYKFRVP